MKTMNHTDYMKRTRQMDVIMLNYIITDAREAIAAMPEGINVGYYMDEIHYCHMELVRRKKAGK